MRTKDILAALHKNKIATQIIPAWACRSVPFPFFCNGVPYLGLYYYPISRQNNETQTFTPILQFVIAHKDGHVVSAVASPFFLKPEEDGKAEIGTYPNPVLKGLAFAEAEAAYDRYFESCDKYLEGGEKGEWYEQFKKVREPGFDTFFERFSLLNVATPSNSEGDSRVATVTSTVEEQTAADVVDSAPSTDNVRAVNPAKLDSAIADLRKLLTDTPFKSRLEDLGNVLSSVRRNRFNVAVVGEFSRGKSTFLNELLCEGPLPTGDLPTTAVLARIMGGDSRKAFFLAGGKPPQSVDCTPEALASFAANAEGRDPNGVLALIMDSPWLKGLPIALFDTPGVGDSVGARAQLARTTIAGCDCTIVAIAATAACSQTELAFIRDAIVAKKVPRVAVLLTKLDTVPEKERSKVVAFVLEKIKPIAPEAELWIPHSLPGLAGGCAQCIGIEAIRKRLAQFVAAPDVASLRLQQKAQVVSELAAMIEGDLEVVEKAVEMSEKKRRKAAEAISEKRQAFTLFYDELSAECERGQLATEIWVKDELSKIRCGLVEDFVHSLRSCRGDIKHWAEEDFPYQAKKEIPRRIRDQFGPKLEARISAFAAKLAKTASDYFSAVDFAIPSASFAGLVRMCDVSELEVNDHAIRKIQIGSTVAKIATVPISMIGMLLACGPGGPLLLASSIGAAATAGASILGGKLADKKTSDLRTELERRIEEEFQRIFDEQQKNIVDVVEKPFGHIRTELKTRLEKTLESALSALKTAEEDHSDTPSFDVKEFHSRLNGIQNRIRSAAML